MDISISGVLRAVNFVLNKIGYKIVPIDEFSIETIIVKRNYFDNDAQVQKEKDAGAEVRWSKFKRHGYYYYEVKKGNKIERYQTEDKAYFWIKRKTGDFR